MSECLACQGSGLDNTRAGLVAFGDLLPLCERCGGEGTIPDDKPDKPYRAAWAVSRRYVVRLAVPRRSGGVVEMEVEWAPRMPPETGRGKIKPTERRNYEAGRGKLKPAERRHYDAGRAAALSALREQLGGGGWSVIEAGKRQ